MSGTHQGAAAANEAPESEEGVSSGHIDMVMSHTSCTRNEAIRALRAADDDTDKSKYLWCVRFAQNPAGHKLGLAMGFLDSVDRT